MHLLVTNDFPPKVGGIQSYLWELWRRLPSSSFAVLTTAHPGDTGFDAAQPFRVERVPARVLLPTGALARRINALAKEVGAGFVVLDPALPLGMIGPRLDSPYLVVGHGAEITVPGRIPATGLMLGRVLRGCAGTVAAGSYVAGEMRRAAGRELPGVVVPPGVDIDRFRPIAWDRRAEVRRSLGLPEAGSLIVNVGRLVPRKGAGVLIEAAGRLKATYPDLVLAVAGGGRERPQLERQALRRRAPVVFLGKVPDDDLAGLYACADVFAAPNRSRWGGLEQEGFGIVFLEAAACGVAQVAGNSGGAPEAVAAGETGILIDRPGEAREVAAGIARLLDDARLRQKMGERSRQRAVAGFSYPVLARRLEDYLTEMARSLAPTTR